MSDSSGASLFSRSDLRRFASEICADDEEIFTELIGDCRNDIDMQLTSLKNARAQKEWRDFNRAAHSIKSAARTFGSPLLKELSLGVEKASEGGVADADIESLDAKTREMEKVALAFKAELGNVLTDPTPYLG